MLKNQVISLGDNCLVDSKLIVFLNYQGLFLVFSRTHIELYNSFLTKLRVYYSQLDLKVSLPKHCKYADNTYDNIAYVSTNQDILICYYNDKIRTGKLDFYDLFSGENFFSRDSRSIYPSDNYALEDVSGIYYDFEKDFLYTGFAIGVF